MSSEQDNVITSLCCWIGSLELPSGTPSVELLFTGRPVAEALHIIDNDFFDAHFLDEIPSCGIESNWRIKASSMRKIHEKIVNYYNVVLGRPTPTEWHPGSNDINAVVERMDHRALGQLLLLVLGAATLGTNGEKFIRQISALDNPIQSILMTAISVLQKRSDHTLMQIHRKERMPFSAQQVLPQAATNEECRALRIRCFDLEQQVSRLLHEKDDLMGENEKLYAKLARKENSNFAEAVSTRQTEPLKRENETLEEELLKHVEAEKEDYRKQCDMMGSEIRELKKTVKKLSSFEVDFKRVQDENDELKGRIEKMRKEEAILAAQHREKIFKLENQMIENGQLHGRNRKDIAWDEKSESEAKDESIASLKVHLEAYKRSVVELEHQLRAEIKRADKAEFLEKRLIEKLESAHQECERQRAEIQNLKEINESNMQEIDLRSMRSFSRNSSIACIQTMQWSDEQHERDLFEAMKTVDELRASLIGKDSIIRATEMKFNSYMEKARKVIIELDEVNQIIGENGTKITLLEFNRLRDELVRKQQKIDRLEEFIDKHRTLVEQEQRLIVTAFYESAIAKQKMAAAWKYANTETPFLTIQRMLSSKRNDMLVGLSEYRHEQKNNDDVLKEETEKEEEEI